ncbi:MAG: hypothetical protein ACQESQ_09395 [Bacteroidota bacterium]
MNNLQELSSIEYYNVKGGWGFLAGLAAGYVFSEVMNGIYQAEQKDWECDQ